MKEIPDDHLRSWAEGLAASDRNAFDALFRALYPALVNYAMKITKDRDAAGDVVQDAFILLWKKRREVDPDRSVRAYLYRSVRNRALNYLRDQKEIAEPIDDLLTDESQRADALVQNDQKEEEQFRKQFYEWVNALPERQRETFELSRFEGLNHHEIAKVMEVSAKTVNNHLTAALSQLRDWYDTYQQESRLSK